MLDNVPKHTSTSFLASNGFVRGNKPTPSLQNVLLYKVPLFPSFRRSAHVMYVRAGSYLPTTSDESAVSVMYRISWI